VQAVDVTRELSVVLELRREDGRRGPDVAERGVSLRV